MNEPHQRARLPTKLPPTPEVAEPGSLREPVQRKLKPREWEEEDQPPPWANGHASPQPKGRGPLNKG